METNESKNNGINVENEKKALKLPNLPVTKLIPLAIIVGVVVVVTSAIAFSKPSIKKSITSIMQNQTTISQLSALKVPYGGIYIEKNEKGEETNRFLYKGDVTYTIDFNNIRISEGNKTIKVEIPNVGIKRENVVIEPKSIKWINNHRYNTQKLMDICTEDILQQYETNSDTKKLAEESVSDTIKNFITPIVRGIDKRYIVEVHVGEEK